MVKAIQLNLSDDVNTVPWEQVFNSGAHVLDRLLAAAGETPFGLFIFSPVIELANISEPDKKYLGVRDNVILEAGIFFGQYGKSHTIILEPENLPEYKQPTDLKGLISISYDYIAVQQAQGTRDALTNLKAALGTPCVKVLKQIQDARCAEQTQETNLAEKESRHAQDAKLAVSTVGSDVSETTESGYATVSGSVDGWGFATQFLAPLEPDKIRPGQPVVSGIYGMGTALTPVSILGGVPTVIVRFGPSDIPIRLDRPYQLYDPYKHR